MAASRVRGLLIVIWLVGIAVPFFIILAQSAKGLYGDKVGEAWAWFFPCFIPTVGFMIAIATSNISSKKTVISSMTSRVAFGCSVFYLVVLNTTLLLQPVSSSSPLELLRLSHFWLTPTQALADGTLVTVFLKR